MGNTKLTPKQSLFIKEYLIDFNATKAAERAGYSIKTAMKIGSENLHKPEIVAAIKVEQDKTSKKLEITRESILMDLEELKLNNKQTNPQAALKALELQVKILGFNAPTEQKINLTQEQPLFSPLDNNENILLD